MKYGVLVITDQMHVYGGACISCSRTLVLFNSLPLEGFPTKCSDEELTMCHSPSARETDHHQSPAAKPMADEVSAPEEESDHRGTQQVDNKHLSNGHEHERHRNESHVGQSQQCASPDQDGLTSVQHQRNLSKYDSSDHAQQFEAENQTELEVTGDQEEPILNIKSFTAYVCVRKFSYSTRVVAFALTALMCMQMFLVSMDCYESYGIRSEHSHCSCSFPFPWLVTAMLRITSRFAFPLLLSIVFWRHVVCRRAGSAAEGQAVTKGKFSAEIQKKRNHPIVLEFCKKHWDSSVKQNADGATLLRSIQDELNAELNWMCLTSLLQSAILVVSLFAFHLVAFDVHDNNWVDSSFWLGIVDLLSFGIILAVSGVMLSFYFLESKIKRCVRAIYTLSSKNRALREKAKAKEHCLTRRWYPLEIGMRYASVIIPVILIMTWASDVPLSCGFSVSVEAITNHSAAACWLGFILVIVFGQVMVTSPFRPFYIRWTGLGMESVVLCIFYWTFPTYKWIQLIHILYAIVPLSYLIWYHVASIRRQWIAVNTEKEENPSYVSRLSSRIGFFILILATLVASLRTEYSHLNPSAIGKYSTADIDAQPTIMSQSIIPPGISGMTYERALLRKLAEKHNAMVYFVEGILENDSDDCDSSHFSPPSCNVLRHNRRYH